MLWKKIDQDRVVLITEQPHIIYENVENDNALHRIEVLACGNDGVYFSFGFPQEARDFYIKMKNWLQAFSTQIISSEGNLEFKEPEESDSKQAEDNGTAQRSEESGTPKKSEMLLSVSSKNFNIRQIFNFLFKEKQIDESMLAILDTVDLKDTEEKKTDDPAGSVAIENYDSLIQTINCQIKKLEDGVSFFSIGKGKKAALIKEALQHTLDKMKSSPELFKSPDDVLNFRKDDNSRSLKEALNYNRLLVQREKTNTFLEVESFLYPRHR